MFQENLNAGFNYPSPELLAFTRRRLALFSGATAASRRHALCGGRPPRRGDPRGV